MANFCFVVVDHYPSAPLLDEVLQYAEYVGAGTNGASGCIVSLMLTLCLGKLRDLFLMCLVGSQVDILGDLLG